MAPNRGLEVSIGSKASFGASRWFQIESWKPQLVPKQASYSPQANGGLNFYMSICILGPQINILSELGPQNPSQIASQSPSRIPFKFHGKNVLKTKPFR